MSIHDMPPEPSTSHRGSTSDSENGPPVKELKSENFEWDEFLEDMECHPSTVSSLWKHCTFMEKQVFDVIFAKGTMVFVSGEHGAIRPATIILSLGLECNVEYQDVGYNDSEWVSLNQMVTDPWRSDQLKNELEAQLNIKLNFVNMHYADLFKNVLGDELHTLIKRDQYFEIVDKQDPRVLHIGKVLDSHGGILVYSDLDGKSMHSIHILNERCYPAGFGLENNNEFLYDASALDWVLNNPNATTVPAICFQRCGPEPHSFQKGNLVEILDEKTGFVTYPANISEILNSRYAVADVHTHAQLNPERIVISKNTAGVYPINFPLQNKIAIQEPLITSIKNLRFNWKNYRCVTNNLHGTSAEQNTLNNPNRSQVHCMQYVEYFCYELGFMTPGLIVRSKLDSIWIATGLNRGTPQAIHCFVGSTSIFPVRFAEKHGLPFCALPDIPVYLPPKPENSEQSRYHLDRSYKSIPGPIFRKPQYSGRGRPEKTWHFMTDWNVRGDNWVSPIKITRTCRIGPWLDPKMFSGLKQEFNGGNIADVTEQIFKEFFRCTKFDHRSDVIAAFNVSDTKQIMPKQVIKYRIKSEGYIAVMTVQACESCEAFPGWLRTFLRSYGCCPNLLSIGMEGECDRGCNNDIKPNASYNNDQNISKLDGNATRRKNKKEISKVGGKIQGLNSSTEANGKYPRFPDVPHYAFWTKQQLINYLLEHNPHIKVQLKHLSIKKTTATEILQCRDTMSVARLGFRPKEATKVFEALDNLRLRQS